MRHEKREKLMRRALKNMVLGAPVVAVLLLLLQQLQQLPMLLVRMLIMSPY
jgi:hypothetical protein